MTTLEVPAEELQSQAREAYRRSVGEGRPLNRAQLAEMFGRSESWARDRITEVRRDDEKGYRLDGTPGGDTDAQAGDTVPAVHSGPDVHGADIRSAEAVEQTPVTAVDSPDMTPAVGDMTPAATPVGSHPGARFVAWFGFAFGSLVSIAANVLAAWLPAGDMPPEWAPSLASQLGAGVWPLALLVSVEVLSRVAWPSGWLWLLVRFGGVAAVGLGSALISYGHIHDVLLSWGYDPLGAGVGPLVIDGLMVVSGFALLAMSSTRTNR